MKILLRILAGIAVFVFVIILLSTFVAEPWVRKKIQIAFNENSVDYKLKIGEVHLSVFQSAIALEDIIVHSVPEQNGSPDLTAVIASVEFKGINLWKAIFKNDVELRELTIFDCRFQGKVPFPEKRRPAKISSLKIRIDSLFVDKLNASISDSATSKAFSIKDGVWKVYDIKIEKLDTISPGNIFRKFDFDVQELQRVAADSMYTFTATGINYSSGLKTLMISDFSIHPNYKDYDFTSRHRFETDRIEADLKNIHFYDFSAANFLNSRSLETSYIEIGELDVDAFRDKRKPHKKVKVPAFQEMIYDYPGALNIDSIGILAGNISYSEHAEKANEPGIIRFNQFNARLYKITNDTIYKTEKAFMELKTEALLMGKGKVVIALKAELFNHRNTFTVDGGISKMEIGDLNSMLENNAFIYVTSGTIDDMNFSFTANNTKALGKMTLLYHGLDIAVKNKLRDDTTGVKAWFLTVIANHKIMDANPIPGKKLRIGIIDKERDPERFLFNYCAKSIFSGISQSLNKASREPEKRK